jgi:hypothetical protein
MPRSARNPTSHLKFAAPADLFKAAVRDSLPHVSTWWPQILAAITTGVTDAASEGINRAIKTTPFIFTRTRCKSSIAEPRSGGT